MAEYHLPQAPYVLTVPDGYVNRLDMEGFSLMLKDPSYCYKFYWLEALVRIISRGERETDFGGVIDEMIVNAWYSVLGFHIHLSGTAGGEIRDGLERAVTETARLSGLGAEASPDAVRRALREYAPALKKCREQLTNMVPYRALAGFFRLSGEMPPWDSPVRMTAFIRRVNAECVTLPYTLGDGRRLEKEVRFHPVWAEMLRGNAVSVLGWIQYEKIKWLQTNNPEVPGLVYKLSLPDEKMRRLSNARKLWTGIMETVPVRDLYSGAPLTAKEYDLDHFIPWSFTMSDELWNLAPADASLNAAKNNRLPRWDVFFPGFAGNQYLLYRLKEERRPIRALYMSCLKDNMHSLWAEQQLYRPGNTREEFVAILEKNMRPVYDSARIQGYEIWNYPGAAGRPSCAGKGNE